MSHVENLFRLTANKCFMERRGPAWYAQKTCCEKKLCFVATDQTLLADVLRSTRRAARLLLRQVLGLSTRRHVPGSMLRDPRT